MTTHTKNSLSQTLFHIVETSRNMFVSFMPAINPFAYYYYYSRALVECVARISLHIIIIVFEWVELNIYVRIRFKNSGHNGIICAGCAATHTHTHTHTYDYDTHIGSINHNTYLLIYWWNEQPAEACSICANTSKDRTRTHAHDTMGMTRKWYMWRQWRS